MKVFTCKTTAVGAEKLWDASMGRHMMIHYVGKTQSVDLEPSLYIYEVTMDEEEALFVVLSTQGVFLSEK